MVLQIDRLAVPVAGEEDAKVTCEAIRPYLAAGAGVTIIYVIEKGGGGIDPAPIGAQKERAHRFFTRCSRELSGHAGSVDHTITFHTDVVTGILEAARDSGADVIAFTPRKGGRLLKFATGDTAFKLVHRADRPVVVVPTRTTKTDGAE